MTVKIQSLITAYRKDYIHQPTVDLFLKKWQEEETAIEEALEKLEKAFLDIVPIGKGFKIIEISKYVKSLEIILSGYPTAKSRFAFLKEMYLPSPQFQFSGFANHVYFGAVSDEELAIIQTLVQLGVNICKYQEEETAISAGALAG